MHFAVRKLPAGFRILSPHSHKEEIGSPETTLPGHGCYSPSLPNSLLSELPTTAYLLAWASTTLFCLPATLSRNPRNIAALEITHLSTLSAQGCGIVTNSRAEPNSPTLP